MRDLRQAVRQLLKNPGFAGVVVCTLALGIGANTAVFTVVNDVLLRSLPVKNPDELVLFRSIEGRGGRLSRAGENNGSIDPVTGRSSSTSFSLLTFERFRDHHEALSDVFAYAPFGDINVLVDGQAEASTLGQFVSGGYYAGLGVRAILGRTIAPADDQATADLVAVISYRYWEARFGREPGILGKTIRINQIPVSLIGVTPPGFAGAMQVGESPDITVPLAHHARLQPERGANRAQPWYWWIRIMGRLAPKMNAAQARASLEPIFQQTAREGWLAGQALDFASREEMPAATTLAADPGSQGENDRRRQYTSSLHILTGLVSLVLLASCANVAALLIARNATRRRDIAVRLALGASRSRVVRELFTESLLLASLGASLGVVWAQWSRGLFVALRQFGGARVALDLPLDRRVLGFTMAVAGATAVLCGLAPALRASRVNLANEFQGGLRVLGAGTRSRLSRSLVVVQIAVSLVLLVSTGLFVTTLRNLQHVDVGFNARQMVMFRVDALSAGYTRDQFSALHTRLQQRIERIPGVHAATFSRVALLSGTRANRRISVPGYTPPPGATMAFNINGLAENFFTALEIPLVLGRSFDGHDSATAPGVAIVNQTFARKLFGDENPLGRRLDFGANPNAPAMRTEIVGVAGDAKYTGLRERVPPTIYLPAAQMLEGGANYYVRAVGDASAVFPAVRAAVRDIDPTLPVIDFRTLDTQIDRLTEQERLFARLSSFFGMVALLLSCVGLYGLLSYLVIHRTGEIGLRKALGAVPGDLLRMILRESLTLVAFGLGLGVATALGASRFVVSMLFGLSPVDPRIYGSVAMVLVAVALSASLLPARRAAHVDPMTALRAD